VFEGVGGTGGMHGLGDYDAAVTAVVARTADHHARLIGLTCSRARDAVLLDDVAELLKAITFPQRGGGVVDLTGASDGRDAGDWCNHRLGCRCRATSTGAGWLGMGACAKAQQQEYCQA